MCGRYTLVKLVEISGYFPWIDAPTFDMQPRYNIAPTQPILAATNEQGPDGRYHFQLLRWGLVPSWARDLSVGNRMFNARCETLLEKPAFRTSARQRRCLIPADGFYEWRKEPDGTKTPMHIRLKGGGLFAFGGLWEEWVGRDTGELIRSCTIITTSPNDLTSTIHDRMPVIVPRDQQQHWLTPGPLVPDQIVPMLKPFPADQMEATPVDPPHLHPR